MKHETDFDFAPLCNRDQRGCDRGEAGPPAFAPVAGDQQTRSAVIRNGCRQSRLNLEQSVDSRVAGDTDFARHALAREVQRGEVGWSEQELGS